MNNLVQLRHQPPIANSPLDSPQCRTNRRPALCAPCDCCFSDLFAWHNSCKSRRGLTLAWCGTNFGLRLEGCQLWNFDVACGIEKRIFELVDDMEIAAACCPLHWSFPWKGQRLRSDLVVCQVYVKVYFIECWVLIGTNQRRPKTWACLWGIFH